MTKCPKFKGRLFQFIVAMRSLTVMFMVAVITEVVYLSVLLHFTDNNWGLLCKKHGTKNVATSTGYCHRDVSDS